MGSREERTKKGEEKNERVLGREHEVLRNERVSFGKERRQKVQ